MLNVPSQMVYRWLARPVSGGAHPVFDYLVFKVDRLGDFILATAAIRHLLQTLAGARIGLVVSDIVLPWARLWFPGTEIIGIPNVDQPSLRHMWRACLRARRRLAGVSAKQVIVLRHQRSDYHALALMWLRPAHSIGYCPDALPWKGELARLPGAAFALHEYVAPAHPYPLDSNRRLCRELWWHWAVVRHFDPQVQAQDLIPFVPEAVLNPLTAIEAPYWVLAPMGSSALRDYPMRASVALAATLLNETTLAVRVLGMGNQQPRLQQGFAPLSAAVANGRLVIQTHLNMQDYVQTLAQAAGVVTVETATAHLALALRRPTTVLVGGGHYGHFGPWHCAPRQVWLTHELPCFGCDWNCRWAEPECISHIETEKIAGLVLGWCPGNVGPRLGAVGG